MDSAPSNDSTVAVGVAPAAPLAATLRAQVGRYIVLDVIGTGGMGRVLRAYDPKLQREVALKEVRREALGSEGTARLVSEARAMAKLSHPNVVAVFDVEELESDLPGVVLVMEYVRGTTLKDWLRNEERSWSEIVRRFVEAGRGLAAANAAGLLHRDFKPANVLVSRTDRATVKVTDFGLAKGLGLRSSGSSSLDSSIDSHDQLTEAGTVMGTPRYMAPEQHENEELTPAADQYAFCVSLWEALNSKPPFSGDDLSAQKEGGPPPWTNSAVPRPVLVAIERGLATRPSDRWPSLDGLLEALEYDPARRRKMWVAGLATVGMVALAGASLVSWSRARAERCSGSTDKLAGVWDATRRAELEETLLGLEASYAKAVWETTSRVLDDYAARWASMHHETCDATTVRGEQSEAVMDLRMACLHRARTDFEATVDVLRAADSKVLPRAHRVVAGLRPLWRCADIEALQAEVEPPRPQEHEAVEHIRFLLAQVRAQRKAGRYEGAKSKLEAAMEAARDVSYEPLRTELAVEEGFVSLSLGKTDDAVVALDRSLELASRHQQWTMAAEAAATLVYAVGYHQQKPSEGLRYLPVAKGLASDPEMEASVGNSLAAVLEASGKYEEAEAEHRRVLALKESVFDPDHVSLTMSRNNLANALQGQGKHAEAEAEHRQVLATRERTLGPQHPLSGTSRNNLANTLRAQGRHEDAETELRRSIAVLEAALGAEHREVAGAHNNLGLALQAQKKYEAAETEFRHALSLSEKVFGPKHPMAALVRTNLGDVLHAQGEYEQAEAELRRATERLRETLGLEHPNMGEALNRLARTLRAQGKDGEADAVAQRARNAGTDRG